MKSMSLFVQTMRSAFVAGALMIGSSVPVAADEAKAPAAPTVKPEIGKPIQAAQELIKAKKGKEALARVREADMVTDRTNYETYIIELTRGQAAAVAGDPAMAGVAFELAIASAPSGKLQLMAAAAGQFYLAKNYLKAADWAGQFRVEGGNDPGINTVHVQSLYLSGNLPAATKALRAEVQAAETSDKAPAEQILQMLADITNRQKDTAGYISALEKLVAYHPEHNYWLSLIYSISTKPGMSDRLKIDVLRANLATGTLRSADEYSEGVQLALQAGFPSEAEKFLRAGFEAKLLGEGSDADRHKRLKDSVIKAMKLDEAAVGQDDARISVMGGDAQFNTGFNYVFRGQGEKGIPMMEAAFQNGTLKRPEESKLRLGIAQVMAGQRARGIERLKNVYGSDGSAEIARLWILIARSRI
jgi:hypothetical protein